MEAPFPSISLTYFDFFIEFSTLTSSRSLSFWPSSHIIISRSFQLMLHADELTHLCFCGGSDMYIYILAQVHVCAHASPCTRTASCSTILCLVPVKQGLSLNLELGWHLAILATLLSIPPSLTLGLQAYGDIWPFPWVLGIQMKVHTPCVTSPTPC